VPLFADFTKASIRWQKLKLRQSLCRTTKPHRGLTVIWVQIGVTG
jgi:hypothetical protein